MTLLTLDLSSAVGWTVGFPINRNFLFGTHQLPVTGSDVGLFAHEFDYFLQGIIKQNEVKLTVFEAPILPSEARLMTLRKLYGLCWHTEFVCRNLNVECLEANLANVKKYVTGNGHARKQQMLDAVRGYGYDAKTFDEADAIGVRLYTLSQRYPDAAHALKLDLGLLGLAAR